VPLLEVDVHDVASLGTVADHLFPGDAAPAGG
jgi:hypothetical protein